ncbi:MAG: sulfotransferase [Pseudomonadota bacterium]
MSHLRVVNLALPKTGTTTLTDALRAAGLTVADWKIRAGQTDDAAIVGEHVGKLIYEDYFASTDPLRRLRAFDVINEMSAVRADRSFWPQTDWGVLQAMLRQEPEIKFILTRRDPAATANSMMRWNSLGKRRLPRADVPGLPRGFGTSEAELAQWIAAHYSFCDTVFAGHNNFMSYDINDPQAPEKISNYLAVALPWWGQSNANSNAAAAI